MSDMQGRNADILESIVVGIPYDDPPQSRNEDLLIQVKELIESGSGGGGGGGGTAGVNSFNGRRNAVVPVAGDYTASMIRLENNQTVEAAIMQLLNTSTIDAALNPSSRRAVQNRVVTQEINNIKARCLPAGGRTGDLLAKSSTSDYATEWVDSSNLMKKSDYDRNNNGKVDKADTSDALQGATYKATLKNTSANTYVLTEEDKAKKNGVVPLDENRKILPEFLPDSIMNGLTNGGIFNATTRVVRLSDAAKSILGVSYDTMTLEDSRTVPEGYPANAELYYITTNAGTFASMDFVEGDWLISLGNKWEQLKNGNQVSSVNGETGAVILDSDDIAEGTVHLYMTAAERAKLRDIEAEATKDLNVIQKAEILTLTSGSKVLKLTNKNGNITEFAGGGEADLTDYLKKDGNSSDTYVLYSTTGQKTSFTGRELTAVFFEKVVAWLNRIEAVAWTGDYGDLSNTPYKTSDFINDGAGVVGQPYITRNVNNLSNYYTKQQSYTKVEIDNLVAALEGNAYERVDELPTTDINPKVIYYVPVDPLDETKGYNRYQRMSNRWVFLGTSDIDMNEYLKKNGAGDNVTVSFSEAADRVNLANNDKLSVAFGKLSKWFADFKEIAFTGSWQDLEDADELATQEDLEDYVEKQWLTTDSGKFLGIDVDGKVIAKEVAAGVVRPSVGTNSVAWNDTIEDMKNEANGENATAYGNHVIAYGNDKVAHGKYNYIDYGNLYAEQVGGGTSDSSRMDIYNLTWDGKGYFRNGVSVGNTTNHIVEPENGNDLTTKTYVDRTIEEEIASSGLLRSMIVNAAPAVEDADDNILYLVPDATSEGHYLQYKKVLQSQNPDVYIMANLGGTQLSMEGSQVTYFPTPSRALDGTVYQYVGTNPAYKFGAMYACLPMQFYAWWDAEESKAYYTDTLALKPNDPIYGTQAADKYHEATKIGSTSDYLDLPNRIRDQFNYYGQPKWYTRYADGDVKGNWRWVRILGSTGDLVNNGNGTGGVDDYFLTREDYLTKGEDITTVTDSTTLSKVVPETGTVVDVMAKKLFDYMANKIYPVGSIYMTMDVTFKPGDVFGGTWQKIEDRFLLASGSTYNVVNSTGGSKEITIQRSDLPNVNISTSSNGYKQTNIDTSVWKYTQGGQNNKFGMDYGRHEEWMGDLIGNLTTANNHTHSFDLNGNVTQTKLNNMPPYVTVVVWKRTA